MSDFPRQDTSWEAMPDDTLPAPRPIDDVLDSMSHDDIDTQLKKLEEIRQEQQDRISKLLISIKEKRRCESNSKAATKKFSDAEKASIRTVFDKYDSNSSGFIEPGEFHKMVEELGVKIPEASIPSIIKSLAGPEDTNKLNFDAFLAWWGCDSTRGGNKGLALALTRGKLKALHKAKKGSERVNAAKLKAAIGLPIEVDTSMSVGEVKVPRTQLYTKVSTSRKEDFDKIASSKFPDTKLKMVVVASLVFDLATDVDPKKMAKFKDAVPLAIDDLKALSDKSKSDIITDIHFTDESCTVDIGIAADTDKILNLLFCTTAPDQDELDKFISEAETDIRMGVDLSKLLRESYRDGRSMVEVINDGLRVNSKGRISPSLIALLRAVAGSSGSGEKAVFIRKCAEVGISSLQGYSCDMKYRSKQEVLATVTNFFMTEVKKELTDLKGLEYEEDQLKNELQMLSNLLVHRATMKTEQFSLANFSPRYSKFCKVKKPDSDCESDEGDSSDSGDDGPPSGWSNNDCWPSEFMFLLHECVSEIKSVKAWSPWIKFSFEGTGLALTAGLPSCADEVRGEYDEKVYTSEYRENKTTIAWYDFPIMKKAYEIKEEGSDADTTAWSILDVLEDLFDEQEDMRDNDSE